MDRILRQFLMVAELKSVTQAAKRLFVSQPTLTHNMKKLEADLQVDLFVRTSRGMGLTEYGEVLLEQTRIMHRVHENTLVKLGSMKVSRERGFRAGVGFAWWHLFFRELYREYRQAHPEAPAHIDTSNHLRCMDQLISGDIDFLVGHRISGLSPRLGVVFEPLFEVRDAAYVRAGHPLLESPCSLDNLLAFPAMEVTPDESRYSRQVIEDPGLKQAEHGRYHLTERVVWSSSSMSIGLDILQESDAIMTYPESMAPYFATFGVYPLQMQDAPRPMAVGLYTLEDREDDESLLSLKQMILDYLPGVSDQVTLLVP